MTREQLESLQEWVRRYVFYALRTTRLDAEELHRWMQDADKRLEAVMLKGSDDGK